MAVASNYTAAIGQSYEVAGRSSERCTPTLASTLAVRESLRLALVDKAYVFVRNSAASVAGTIHGRIDA